MPQPLQFGFQDANSPIIEELLHFHDHAIVAVFLISTLVLYIITLIITTKLTNTSLIDAQEIEIVWTIIPAIILIAIALPSLRILYLIDEISNPYLTIKAIGHQWYWSYEYSDYNDVSFDSYILPTSTLSPGQLRLLEVDHRVIIPTEAPIRILVTAEDVLHSWALPSFGVKTDAIPGRLNQTSFISIHPGVFYGQCSEICGTNHSFIPIVVEATTTPKFNAWALHNA